MAGPITHMLVSHAAGASEDSVTIDPALLSDGEAKVGGTADRVWSWVAHPGTGEVIRIDPSVSTPSSAGVTCERTTR